MSRSVAVVNLDDATTNPYLRCMVGALRDQGVEVSATRLSPSHILRARRAGVSAVHVHWPEYLIYRAGRHALLRELVAFARVIAAILLCKATRIRLVWTVHNLKPHEEQAGRLQRWSYPVIARAADVFVTHSLDAGRRAAARFPRARTRLVVAPHGNYAGMYPATPQTQAEQQSLRSHLGVPDGAVLLLAFGQVRAYKRLAELAELVDRSSDDIHLLVAGAPVDEGHAARVREVAGRSRRVHADLRRIPDEEVAVLYAASDLAALHYREVFSSGALLLALTEGVAVVTPRSEAAAEVAEWPALGVYDDDALEPAVRALVAEPASIRREAAKAAAARATWSVTADRLATAYFGRERVALAAPASR